MTSTPDNNGAFNGLVTVRPKADIERDELRKLIVEYTDELLKRAIATGTSEKSESSESTDPDEAYRKLMSSILPRPSKILDGITMLYMADIDRANARMRQYFETVQKIPSMNDQLTQCYAMLKCMNGGYWWTPFTEA